MLTPFDGPQTPNSVKDVFNLQLSRARQVIERAFGMMIARWRILAGTLAYSIKRNVKVVKACVLLHNLALRSRKSSQFIVTRSDVLRRPFKAKCPLNGVVPKVRLHLDNYVTNFPMVDGFTVYEKQAKELAAAKRSAIAFGLQAKGYERNQPRGKKRGAAYQQHIN
jgi:hypothetical protein